MTAYITQAQLEARVSVAVLRQVTDDDNSGSADSANVTAILDDATSFVNGYCRGIYTIPFTAPVPNEIVRICLDVAVAYLAMRHPEYCHREWRPLLEMATKELESLRLGKTRLDVVSSPEPAKNTGGTVRSGNPDYPDPVDHVWLNTCDSDY